MPTTCAAQPSLPESSRETFTAPGSKNVPVVMAHGSSDARQWECVRVEGLREPLMVKVMASGLCLFRMSGADVGRSEILAVFGAVTPDGSVVTMSADGAGQWATSPALSAVVATVAQAIRNHTERVKVCSEKVS